MVTDQAEGQTGVDVAGRTQSLSVSGATGAGTTGAGATGAGVPGTRVTQEACGCEQPASGGDVRSYVYAFGNVSFRFPNISIERELTQANAGISDSIDYYEVLSRPHNQYLVRQLCWILSISGVETYILAPSDPAMYAELVNALRFPDDPNEKHGRLELVVGLRGPRAPAEACNGLLLPIVRLDQLYSFTHKDLITAAKDAASKLPEKEALTEKEMKSFDGVATSVFDERILQLADNAGASDEHRALNYMAVRIPQFYMRVVRQRQLGAPLSRIDVLPSRMADTSGRRLVNIVLAFRDANGVEDKFRTRIDVTDEFPFRDLPLSPYYDRS